MLRNRVAEPRYGTVLRDLRCGTRAALPTPPVLQTSSRNPVPGRALDPRIPSRRPHRAVPTAPSPQAAPRVGADLGLETVGVGGAESGIAAERPPRSFRCPFSVDRCRV